MSTNTGMAESLASDYAAKKEDYYDVPRREMLPFVPVEASRILDVGCGRGTFGNVLRERAQCEVWGVEPDSRSIPYASKNLYKVLHGCFEPGIDLPKNYFDAILFNDVLEHILDPKAALIQARELLKDTGVIVASIPNIGHFPIIWKLVMRGDWDYQERGILDKTHLRFFTRNNIVKMFQAAGFKIRSIEGINPYVNMDPEDMRLWGYYRWTKLLPINSLKDMRYLQFAVVAEKSKF